MLSEIDQLVGLYERRSISRRALVQGLAALALSSRILGQTAFAVQKPLVQARTLNHVSLSAADDCDYNGVSAAHRPLAMIRNPSVLQL